MLNKFFNWLVKSSADPSQVALTVKGLVSLGVVQGIFALLPSIGLHPTFSLDTLGNAVYSLIDGVLSLVAAIVSLVGIVRKVILTFKPVPPIVQ